MLHQSIPTSVASAMAADGAQVGAGSLEHFHGMNAYGSSVQSVLAVAATRRKLASIPLGSVAGAVTGVMIGTCILTCLGVLVCLYRRRRLLRRGSLRRVPVYHIPKSENPRIHVFTLPELARATGGFNEALVLGKGSAGVVYKGLLPNGKVVAVKRAHYQDRRRIQGRTSTQYHAELDMLSRIHHSHLVKLLGYCLDKAERILVFEFLPNLTLYHHLFQRGTVLSWEQRLQIALQAARALEYLHVFSDPPIIHCK